MVLHQLGLGGKAEDSDKQQTPKFAVGIDLGTTNSLVAKVIDGKPQIIEGTDGTSSRLLRSTVDYQKGQPVAVGNEVKIENDQNIQRIHSAKRLLGISYEEVKKELDAYDFDLVADSNPVEIQLDEKHTVKPIEVSAKVLEKLVEQAQTTSDTPLEGAVITVPAYFDDARRQATKDAAKLAGINVLRLLNEPTAAALAYGLDQGKSGIYVVYDMGGGTFDVSILHLSQGLFKVIATGGDARLGGNDFNKAVLEVATTAEDVDIASIPHIYASKAKEALSTNAMTTFAYNDQELQVTAEDFFFQSQPLVDRSIDILKECLERANVDDTLQGVIMVGGATRMPHLRDAVAEAVNVPLYTDINPDEVVALGAAAQADLLVGNRPNNDWLLLDVNPLSLGIETMGGLVEQIIPRNSSIPIARAQEFTTHKDGQTAMSVHVVQGERDKAGDCRSLARFSVKQIPPMSAGTPRIQVTYRLDADGLLTVTAEEKTTNTKTEIEVKPSYGLSEEQISQMIVDSHKHAKEDATARALAEVKISAEGLKDMLKTALTRDQHLIEDDQEKIDKAFTQLDDALAKDDADQIRTAITQLDKASEGFAQRRMQAAMQTALKGQNVNKL